MKRGRTETMSRNQIQVKFGIVPKLLLGILVPLIASMILMGVFLGLQGSNIVNEVMNEQLNAQADSAANEVNAFFEEYYGISECLAATQIVRDTTNEVVEGGITAHTLYFACWRRYV